jgi:hypothetical protein
VVDLLKTSHLLIGSYTLMLSHIRTNGFRDFADNVGIKFLTPEEYFLKHKPREFRRSFEPATYINEPDPVKDEGMWLNGRYQLLI